VASTIRIRDADKDRLDRLQAEVTARTGRKISQQELLERLIMMGERQKEALMAADEGATEAQLERLLALPLRTGVPTREEDIDEVLYGAGP
jgi:predicted transcriptional regulator